MAQERLSMRKIEEILCLKYEARQTHRAIAQSCGISTATVSEYVSRTKAAGLSWPLPAELSGAELEAQLFPGAVARPGRQIAVPDWATVHKECQRKGVTLSLCARSAAIAGIRLRGVLNEAKAFYTSSSRQPTDIREMIAVKSCPPRPKAIVGALHRAGIMVDPAIFEHLEKMPGFFMTRYQNKPEFEESFFTIE